MSELMIKESKFSYIIVYVHRVTSVIHTGTLVNSHNSSSYAWKLEYLLYSQINKFVWVGKNSKSLELFKIEPHK